MPSFYCCHKKKSVQVGVQSFNEREKSERKKG